MENETFIKAVLFRWMYEISENGQIEIPLTGEIQKKITVDNGINYLNINYNLKLEKTPELIAFFKASASEYNMSPNLKKLFEKYPLTGVVVKKGKIVEKIESEAQEPPADKVKTILKDSLYVQPETETIVEEREIEVEKDIPSEENDVIEEEVFVEDYEAELEKSKKEKKTKKAKKEEKVERDELDELFGDAIGEEQKEEENIERLLKGKNVSKEEKEALKRFQELRATRPRRVVFQEDMQKSNLPYYAVLSYYVADSYITVTDPFLSDFFINFYQLDHRFKQMFIELNPIDRLTFIKEFFNDQKLTQIYDNLVYQRGIYNKPITFFLDNFRQKILETKCEKLYETVNKEIVYNTMFYISSLDLSDEDFSNKDSLRDKILDQVTATLQKRLKCVVAFDEDIAKFLRDFIGMLVQKVNKKEDLETLVKPLQKRAIKAILLENFKNYYTEDDEETQFEIQKLYNSNFSEMLEGLQYRYTDSVPTGRSELLFYLPKEARSDLEKISNYFSSDKRRRKIVKIIENINTKLVGSSKTNMASAETSVINSMAEKGEIDKLDEAFLKTFIKYYGSIVKVPTSFKNNLLELNHISNFPLSLQSKIHKKIIDDANKVGKQLKQAKTAEFEQSDILVDLQYELSRVREQLDVTKITDLINRLNFSIEIKGRLLNDVRKGEFDNIFVIIKNASIKVKKLLNPLHYSGIRRSYRNQALQRQQLSTMQVIQDIPNISGPGKECIAINLLAPWKRLEYSENPHVEIHIVPKDKKLARDDATSIVSARPKVFDKINGMTYFIADVKGNSKARLNKTTERPFFGQEIPLKEFTINADENFGKSWNKGPIYGPTNYFWKVFCANHDNVTWSNDILTIKHKMRLDDKVINVESKFKVGVLYQGKRKDEIITSVFTDEDFANKKKWESENLLLTFSFYDFNRLIISQTKTLREIVRDFGVKTIKECLSRFYSQALPDTKETVIAYSARKLEDAIFTPEINVYNYVKTINTILYFLDPDSPINSHINYYKNLFLNTNPNSYKSLIFKSITQYVPEIYLLDIQQRNQFNASFSSYVEIKTRQNCKHLYLLLNSSKRIETSSSEMTYTLLDLSGVRAHKIFKGVDAKTLVNVCKNKDTASLIDVVVEAQSGLYCFSADEVKYIVQLQGGKGIFDSSKVHLNKLPEDVISNLQNQYTLENVEYMDRLSKIKEEIGEIVENKLEKLISEFDIKLSNPSEKISYMTDILSLTKKDKKYRASFNAIVNEVNSSLSSPLTEDEQELLLQHLVESIKHSYFYRIELLTEVFILNNPSVVELVSKNVQLLKTSTNEEKKKIKSTIKELLEPLSKMILIDASLNIDEGEIYQYVAEFINKKVTKDEVKNVEQDVETTTHNCFACHGAVENPIWRTQYTSDYQNVFSTTFCSRECFETFDDKILTDDSQAVKEQLVKQLLWPFIPDVKVNYVKKDGDKKVLVVERSPHDIISVANKFNIVLKDIVHVDDAGIEIPSEIWNYDYDSIYGYILKTPSFIIPESVLEDRKTHLLLLAEKLGVSKEGSLKDVYKRLKQNGEFMKIYNLIADTYITDRLDNSFKKLVKELVYKMSDNSVNELAKRFNIKTEGKNKGQIIAELYKNKDISSYAKSIKKEEKLINYGIEIGTVTKNKTVLYAEEKAKYWFKNISNIKDVNFENDIFEPYLSENNIVYDKDFVNNFYVFDNSRKIVDSYGQALKTVGKSTDFSELLRVTNEVFKEKVILEYVTTGRTIVENGAKKNIKFDTVEEAERFISPKMKSTPIGVQTVIESIHVLNSMNKQPFEINSDKDLEYTGRNFINNPSQDFSAFVVKNAPLKEMDRIFYIQKLLRDVSHIFINSLQQLEYNSQIDEELSKPVPKRRGIRKHVPLAAPTELEPVKMEKRVKLREKTKVKTEVQETVKTTEQVVAERTKNKTLSKTAPLTSELIIKSEKSLKKMFKQLYIKPINRVPEQTRVTVKPISKQHEGLKGQSGVVYTSPVATRQKYVIKMDKEDLFIELSRGEFEIIKATEEKIEDKVDEIADEILEELEEQDIEDKSAEEILSDYKQRSGSLDAQEEEEELPEDEEEEGEQDYGEVDEEEEEFEEEGVEEGDETYM
jgi:hypothetical protein